MNEKELDGLSNFSLEQLLKLKHKAQDYVRETEQEFKKAEDRLIEIDQELTNRGWGKEVAEG